MKSPHASFVFIVTQVIVLVILTWVVWHVNHLPATVGVVRTAYLIDNYEGIKEARSLLDQRIQKWSDNLDSLRSDLELAIEESGLSIEEYSKMDDKNLPQDIVPHKANFNRYAGAIQEKASIEEEKLMQGALNQINSFVKEYAEIKDYDLIVGLLPSGNILHAKEEIDITDEVLTAINSKYKGIND